MSRHLDTRRTAEAVRLGTACGMLESMVEALARPDSDRTKAPYLNYLQKRASVFLEQRNGGVR